MTALYGSSKPLVLSQYWFFQTASLSASTLEKSLLVVMFEASR
ncbi:hypothetical protein [Sporisorium scitamineum]|uniref:Uncharacterized protein n=1 Tax=Sporisorium scitamineum TaxID=49012 RepID=A0A0F7S772_9BASI|nr:hypothetical protein [Sporisorium scitamineum]